METAELSPLPLFRGVERASLARLAAACRAGSLAAGETLFSAGEKVRSVWLVREGLVRLARFSPLGREIISDVARAGDPIGCLTGDPDGPAHSAAVALTPASFVVIPVEVYHRLLLDSPAFCGNVIRVLWRDLQMAQTLRAVLTEPGRLRVSYLLLWLHERLGRDIRLTRKEMSDLAGLSMETAIRLLSPLEKRGWIRTRRGVIQVLEPEKLRVSVSLR